MLFAQLILHQCVVLMIRHRWNVLNRLVLHEHAAMFIATRMTFMTCSTLLLHFHKLDSLWRRWNVVHFNLITCMNIISRRWMQRKGKNLTFGRVSSVVCELTFIWYRLALVVDSDEVFDGCNMLTQLKIEQPRGGNCATHRSWNFHVTLIGLLWVRRFWMLLALIAISGRWWRGLHQQFGCEEKYYQKNCLPTARKQFSGQKAFAQLIVPLVRTPTFRYSSILGSSSTLPFTQK